MAGADTSIPKDVAYNKRIVLCCDGTWQAANHGLQVIPSNIAKIARATANGAIDENGKYVHQVTYYHAGVGTGTDTVKNMGWLRDKTSELVKKWEGGIGAGLDEAVCEVYNFIVNNYNPGDELYFFGFSRGAYTARAAAGLVAHVGICANSKMDTFFEMYDAYKKRNKPEQDPVPAPKPALTDAQRINRKIDSTKWGQSETGKAWLQEARQFQPKIKVVGVFDTVGSLGLPEIGVFSSSAMNEEFQFHDTSLHDSIENAFHAIALDEHRRPFSPTLWRVPPGSKTKLIQCWFPGMHINVGGGNNDALDATKRGQTDSEAMATLTLAWMVDRCRKNSGLYFDYQQLTEITVRYATAMCEVMQEEVARIAAFHKEHPHESTLTGYFADSIKNIDPVWRAMFDMSRIREPGHYFDDIRTCEYMHPIVTYGMRALMDNKGQIDLTKEYKPSSKVYVPDSLKGFKRRLRADGLGFEWVKTYSTAPAEHLKTPVESVIDAIKSHIPFVHKTPEPKADQIKERIIREHVIPTGGGEHFGERNVLQTGLMLNSWRNLIYEEAHRAFNAPAVKGKSGVLAAPAGKATATPTASSPSTATKPVDNGPESEGAQKFNTADQEFIQFMADLDKATEKARQDGGGDPSVKVLA